MIRSINTSLVQIASQSSAQSQRRPGLLLLSAGRSVSVSLHTKCTVQRTLWCIAAPGGVCQESRLPGGRLSAGLNCSRYYLISSDLRGRSLVVWHSSCSCLRSASKFTRKPAAHFTQTDNSPSTPATQSPRCCYLSSRQVNMRTQLYHLYPTLLARDPRRKVP